MSERESEKNVARLIFNVHDALLYAKETQSMQRFAVTQNVGCLHLDKD